MPDAKNKILCEIVANALYQIKGFSNYSSKYVNLPVTDEQIKLQDSAWRAPENKEMRDCCRKYAAFLIQFLQDRGVKFNCVKSQANLHYINLMIEPSKAVYDADTEQEYLFQTPQSPNDGEDKIVN